MLVGGHSSRRSLQSVTDSAVAERMFSCAGLTKTSRRTSMSDSLFENLVMLKKNKSLWA